MDGRVRKRRITRVGKPKRRKITAAAEDSFEAMVRHMGLPAPVRQFRFAKSIGRQWRFDFAFLTRPINRAPNYHLAVEIEGLTYFGSHIGAHQSAKGFEKDAEKYLWAMRLGYLVLRIPHRWILKDDTIIWNTDVQDILRELLGDERH